MANNQYLYNTAPLMFQLNNQQLNEEEFRNPHQIARAAFGYAGAVAEGVLAETAISYNLMRSVGQPAEGKIVGFLTNWATNGIALTPGNIEKLGDLQEYMPSVLSDELYKNRAMWSEEQGNKLIQYYTEHPTVDRNFGIWRISDEAINQQSIWKYELGRGVVEQLGPDQVARLGLKKNINLTSKSVQEELKRYQVQKGYEPAEGYSKIAKLFQWDKQNRIAQTYQDFQVEQAKQAGKITDDQQQEKLRGEMTKILTNQIGANRLMTVQGTLWQGFNIYQTVTKIGQVGYGVAAVSQQQYESRELKRKYRVIGQMGNYAVVNDKSMWYSKAEQQILQFSLQRAYDLKARVSDTLVMSNPYKQMYQQY